MPAELPAQSNAPARDGSAMVAIVMSEDAARSLAAACQFGKFKVEDWLDDPLKVERGVELRDRAARAREWLDWGQRWLVDGTRIDVPPDPLASGDVEEVADAA